MPSRWTQQDKANLAQHYSAISAKSLTRLFQGRTESAIFHMARKMGLDKCQERKAEAGREAVACRKDRQCAFSEPPSPSC